MKSIFMLSLLFLVSCQEFAQVKNAAVDSGASTTTVTTVPTDVSYYVAGVNTDPWVEGPVTPLNSANEQACLGEGGTHIEDSTGDSICLNDSSDFSSAVADINNNCMGGDFSQRYLNYSTGYQTLGSLKILDYVQFGCQKANGDSYSLDFGQGTFYTYIWTPTTAIN